MAKVLLIDDEDQIAEVFGTALASAGITVERAESGRRGLEMAQATPYQLILLDQMLPDISGNEVLKTLKSQDATRAIPVAILSNFGADTMIKDALFAGAADYILKYQISTDDLISKVQSLVGGQ